MTKTSSEIDNLIKILEKIIDARYMMLKEIDFENHRYAADYRKKHYEPLIEEFKKIIVEKL
jgi:hypothetical protein